MPKLNAQQFVEAMKSDKEFRHAIKSTDDDAQLKELLEKKGFAFSENELVHAMAACMDDMA